MSGRRILALDEILSGVRNVNRKIIQDILWTFTKIGFQFVINEHGFVVKGSKVYHLEMIGNISKIRDTYIEEMGVYLDATNEEIESMENFTSDNRRRHRNNKYIRGCSVKKVKILGLIMVMILGVTACGNKEVKTPVVSVETPVVEENVVVEDGFANMDKVERTAKDLLDVVLYPDNEVNFEKMEIALMEKYVALDEESAADLVSGFMALQPWSGSVYEYTIDRLEPKEEELEPLDGEIDPSSGERKGVPYYLDYTVISNEEGIRTTTEVKYVIYGVFTAEDFRVSTFHVGERDSDDSPELTEVVMDEIEMEESKWFVGFSEEPEPTVEEKAVLEAELKEEVLTNMDKVERVVKDWLDIVTSSDEEYTNEERLEDLVEKDVVVSMRETGDFGETTLALLEWYGKINGYKIDRLEFREMEMEFNDSEYSYSSRRNVVPFYLDVTFDYEKDGVEGTDTAKWLIYGPFRNEDFRGWNIIYSQD